MEWSLLFLLLPVAFVCGWWLARRKADNSSDRRTDLSSDYFKGLNYLLNEQPDKAIDVFVKMLEVDSETVETHLALGNLFRRRGEVDRAIRIHQNLIARPLLSKEQRSQALYELGQDYLRSGMLGRAESLFQELVELPRINGPALTKLLDIYQQEKDWEKSIATAQRVEMVTGERMNHLAAQFSCELAEQARSEGDEKQAQRLIKRALNYDRKCARATLIAGSMEKANGNYKAALRSFQQVEHQNTVYLPETIAPLVECYLALGKPDDAERYLEYIVAEYGGVTALLGLIELIRRQRGDQEAAQRLIAALRSKPSVRGLDRLIQLNLLHNDGTAREDLLVLKDLTASLLKGRPAYQCSHCGLRLKALYWHCPTCKTWSNVKPLEDVSAEAIAE